MKCNFNKFLTA